MPTPARSGDDLADSIAAHAHELPDALVRQHMLAPLAAQAGLARFRADYIASSLLAEIRERTLAETLSALAEHRIPVILLKGISYAGDLYADPAERPMSDIDLMVPPRQHDDACRVLRRLGYWHAGSAQQLSALHHAACFKRKDAAIDLHRSMLQPWRSRMDIDALWRRARPAADRPWALRLEAVDETVVHLAHIARHELGVPAINYVDAARLVARVPGGQAAVLERARSFRLTRAVRAALDMTEALTHGRPHGRTLLPSPAEVLAFRRAGRTVQLVRKAALVEGPVELAGLVAAALHTRLAHRFGP